MEALPAPRCLLFDLDGTLVDSTADLATSANAVRERHGLAALSPETVASYVGDGAAKLVERSFADAPATLDRRTLLREFRRHYHQHCLDATSPYEGVLAGLERLYPLPMAIVSNKPQPMTEKVSEGLGLARWMGAVVGARRGVPVKPHPALLQLALEELLAEGVQLGSLGPGSVWMVGDSTNDVHGGAAIGATTVAVRYGIGHVEDGAHAFVEDFSGLVDLVLCARA